MTETWNEQYMASFHLTASVRSLFMYLIASHRHLLPLFRIIEFVNHVFCDLLLSLLVFFFHTLPFIVFIPQASISRPLFVMYDINTLFCFNIFFPKSVGFNLCHLS